MFIYRKPFLSKLTAFLRFFDGSRKLFFWTNLKTRRVVLTVLNSSSRQSCSVSINVTSALEVFLKRYALYKFTFYLLTYLLTYLAVFVKLVWTLRH